MSRRRDKLRTYCRIYGGTVIDFDSLAWHRAIAMTPAVTLIVLEETEEAIDGIPRVHWRTPVVCRGAVPIDVACRAEPLWRGPAGNVRVQVVRPGDPLFDDPATPLTEPSHDLFRNRLRPPTNEIQIAAVPAAAWAQLVREATILAIGG